MANHAEGCNDADCLGCRPEAEASAAMANIKVDTEVLALANRLIAELKDYQSRGGKDLPSSSEWNELRLILGIRIKELCDKRMRQGYESARAMNPLMTTPSVHKE